MALELLSIQEHATHDLTVEEACRRIPPLWPLQNFVAVNPYLGLSGMPFAEAARLLERVAHGASLMNAEYYLSQIRDGSLSASDVSAALAESGRGDDAADPLSWLEEQLQHPSRTERLLTVADWLDQTHRTSWAAFVVDEISKWCSSYFDRGQSAWQMPWKDLPLYQAWKRAAELDANPEAFGLPGFRRHVTGLPDSADAAVKHALDLLNIPAALTCDFLHRELMSVFGWSAYAAFQDRQGLGQKSVRQLLAIRLAYDTALLSLDKRRRGEVSYGAAPSGFTEAKYIAQLAMEHAFRSKLARKLSRVPPPPATQSRKAFQAIFCIDVRSEVYRRALEAQSPEIETIGFAGFFGMPIDVASSARCPVLIRPSYSVHATREASLWSGVARRGTAVWKSLSTSASACFSSVELGGAWFGVRMLQQLSRSANQPDHAGELTWQIPLAERIDLVAGALRNMSLDASSLAPAVLICGHGSSTENNPYGSSLDCGACGGHKGDVNARFAAALMNDPAVREGLASRGIAIPRDTVFIAGLHNTTTDEVNLGDDTHAPIQRWLKSASRRARRERGRTLLPGHQLASEKQLEREVHLRSADWSEVRPEWGLAGNAAFIAAPRSRTRGLNLAGRVFLHEYDPAADQDASVLQLILTAPVVVASWINLQYYGSTVNNRLFGSGNKVLHNVVGTFGVWEGNGGDLRTGLPMQSLHDGVKWMHEPLRLQVFIEAPRERIDKVLQANPGVRALVENNWIHLMAMAEDSIYECRSLANWQSLGKESAER
jgi:uncharacterized protein YbcC (UPF0753/DUF2309 family)